MEILQLSFCRTSPFMYSSSSYMGKMLVWTNSKPWIWIWVVAELVSPPTLLQPSQPLGPASYFAKVRGGAISPTLPRWKVGQILSRARQATHIRLFLNTILMSSVPPLFIVHKPFSFSFSFISPPYTCSSNWCLPCIWHTAEVGALRQAAGGDPIRYLLLYHFL